MKKISQILSQQLDNNKLGHAYLIFGFCQTDKIAEILKVNRPDQFLCAESPVKIGQIRELISWMQLKPHSSPFKLAIIDKADEMTIEAANALLKMLEEPPASSILVLVAQKKEKILPTILSRCQIIVNISFSESNSLENYLSPADLACQTIKEKFEYAQAISKSEDLVNILNRWEIDFRQKMLEGHDEKKILSEIFRVRGLLLSNSSVKLLLENLLLSF